jgi:hypothetical protein
VQTALVRRPFLSAEGVFAHLAGFLGVPRHMPAEPHCITRAMGVEINMPKVESVDVQQSILGQNGRNERSAPATAMRRLTSRCRNRNSSNDGARLRLVCGSGSNGQQLHTVAHSPRGLICAYRVAAQV